MNPTPSRTRTLSTALASAALTAGLLALPALATQPAAPGTPARTATSATAAAAATTVPLGVRGPASVYRGQKVAFVGAVTTDGAPRPVVLRVWKPKTRTWTVLKQTTTDATGNLTISAVAPHFDTTRRYRVKLPATRGLPAQVNAFTVNVTRAPRATAQWTTPFLPDFTAAWKPRATPAADDATFTVSGVLPGPTGQNRAVIAQRKHTDNWKRVARTTTDATGAYTLTVPADWFVDLQHRLHVPATAQGPALFSQAARLKATPDWRPLGTANDWTHLRTDDGVRQRWNPCNTDPIAYRVNLRLAPEFVDLDMVKQAVAETARATGLKFNYAGPTHRHAFPKASRPWPEGTDMVISWTRNGQSSQRWDGPHVQGLGGVSSYPGTDARGDVGIAFQGHVMLHAGSRFLNRSPENTYGVLKHELGHAVGLNHSRTGWGDQLMDAYYSSGRDTAWGRGDLRGLRQVGATGGCTSGINWWGSTVTGTDHTDHHGHRDSADSHDGPEVTTTVVP